MPQANANESLLTSLASQDFQATADPDLDLVTKILGDLTWWLKMKKIKRPMDPSQEFPPEEVWRINTLPRSPSDPFIRKVGEF